MADEYRGLPGAYASAFRRSDSYLLRAYVLASALVGAFVVVLLVLGVVSWLATPAPLGQRALLGVIGLLVVVPLSAPVLVVARRHRRGTARRHADAVLGLAGFGFVLAVYLALFISAPSTQETAGVLAPVLEALDSLPRSYWILPPLLSVVSIWLAVRLTRAESADSVGDDTGEGPASSGGDGDTERAEG